MIGRRLMADMRPVPMCIGVSMAMIVAVAAVVRAHRRGDRGRLGIVGAGELLGPPERHEVGPARIKRGQERREDRDPVNQDVDRRPLRVRPA